MAEKGKSPDESQVIMTELVLPTHTNALGTIFGGQIMSWVDIAAAISAQKHSRRQVVTASIDALNFLAPVKIGYVIHIRAQVNYTGKTSMEVGVRVEAENPLSGELTHCVSAYTTFVAIGEYGKPVPVPPVMPTTANDKRRYEHAKKRREARLRLAEELKREAEAGEK